MLTILKPCNEQAAIYIRISLDREEQHTSLRNQEDLCKELIEEKGWSFYKQYVDKVSGRTRKRPQFEQLLKDMENGHIQHVVVKEASRLSRNVYTMECIRKISNKHNIHLISVDGEMDTSQEGGYERLTSIGANAQMESDRISLRTKNSLRVQAKRGEFIGSIPPYGYTLSNKKLYVREDDTVSTVHRIFNSYLGGKGAASIARELEQEGIPTPSMAAKKKNATSKWNDTTIYGILKNEAYIGNLVQLVEASYIDEEERKRKKRPECENIRRTNTHQSIIDEEIFLAAQQLRLSKPKKGAKRHLHLFSNLLFCKDCGAKLTFREKWCRGGAYVCSSYLKRRLEINCSNHSISQSKLLEVLSSDLRQKNSSIEFGHYLVKAQLKIDGLKRKIKGHIEALEVAALEIDNKIDRSYERYIDSGSLESESQHLRYKKRQEVVKQENLLKRNRLKRQLEVLDCSDTLEEMEKRLQQIFHFQKLDHLTITLFVQRIIVSENKEAEIIYRFN